MAEANDVISRLTAELLRVLRPLTLASVDERVRHELFGALGWELEALSGFPVTQFITDIEAITAGAVSLATSASNEPKSFDDIAARLDAIKSTFMALRDLSRLTQSGNLNVSADIRAALTRLGEDLLQFLVVDYLRRYWPGLLHAARMLTLVQIPGDNLTFTPVLDAGTGLPPLRRATQLPRVRLDRLGALIRNPTQILCDEYLGASGLATEEDASNAAGLLFDRLAALLASLGANISDGSDAAGADGRDPKRTLAFRFGFPVDGTIAALGAVVTLISDTEGGAGIVITPTGWINATWGTRWWLVTLEISGSVSQFIFRRTGPVLPPGTEAFSLQLASQGWSEDASPVVIIGVPKGTRFELGSIGVAGKLDLAANHQDVGLELSFGKSAIVVSAGDGDGFLQRILPPEGLRTTFDLALGWSTRKGLYFRGSANLEATLPIHQDLAGLLRVQSVYLALRAAGDSVRAATAVTVDVQLGPLKAVVERFGLEAVLTFPPEGGNLGPAHLALTFKPPHGAALTIDAGVVTGGGYLFFDPVKAQYAGAVQLEIGERVSLTAFGLLTTRLPDGSPGFALLVLMAATFDPPIQLGYGFALKGVGGLVGINRTVAIDVLRAGLRAGTLGSILFSADPVRNAPQIVSDLAAVFPPADGRFLFGPVARLSWGTPPLLTLDLGLVLELPAPVRLVLLGRLRVLLPEEAHPVVQLQLDALGVIDFASGDVALDAALYESTVAGFAVTGQMALRANFGARPGFVLAVGGFHPRFPAPPGFPALERVALSLTTGTNLRLRLESYLALTTNTVQFGARLDLFVQFEDVFSLEGMLGFDTLIQFDPFGFVADLRAAVTLKAVASGQALLAVALEMTLSGPTPWQAWGRASFQLLGVSITVRFEVQSGQTISPPRPAPVQIRPLLRAALQDPGNWATQLPRGEHPLVTLRGQADAPLVHPLAALQVSQRVVPLGLEITRFGTTVPEGERRFELSVVGIDGVVLTPSAPEVEVVHDDFAPGQFWEMRDDEQLTAPAFEQLPSGLRLTVRGFTCGTPVVAEYVYEDKPIVAAARAAEQPEAGEAGTVRSPVASTFVEQVAASGAAGMAPLHHTGPAKYRTAPTGDSAPARAVTLKPPTYVVAGVREAAVLPSAPVDAVRAFTARAPALEDTDRTTALSYTAAREAVRQRLATHPDERAQWRVVPFRAGVSS